MPTQLISAAAVVVAVVCGLAFGIVAAQPQRGNPLPGLGRWYPALLVIVVLGGVCLLLSLWVTPPVKASLLAGSGACVMGLQSGLFAASIALIRRDHWAMFATWQPYALIVASLTGFYLIQNAFQAGPVAANVPVLDASLPIVSIGIGIAVFEDPVRTDLLGLAGAFIGIALLLLGIVGLDTSPVVRREQRVEDDQKAPEYTR